MGLSAIPGVEWEKGEDEIISIETEGEIRPSSPPIWRSLRRLRGRNSTDYGLGRIDRPDFWAPLKGSASYLHELGDD